MEKILIVDDSVLQATQLKNILQEGYDNDADRAQAVRSALAAPAD